MRQQERTDQAEHGGIDGDAQRQRDHRSCREAGRLDQLTQRKSHVSQNAFQGLPLPRLPAVLFNQADIAELPPSGLLRLDPRHATLH